MNDEANSVAADTLRDQRPGLVVIANCMAPYRADFHARLVAGIPELQLHSLITHGPAEFNWEMKIPDSINATYYGMHNDSPIASPLRFPLREWHKGSQLIDYLRHHDTRAVILLGYRYLSYLRVIRWCHRAGIPLFYHNDSNIRSERFLSWMRLSTKNLVYKWWMPRVTGIFSMGKLGDQFFLQYGANPKRIYHVPWTPNYDHYVQVEPNALREFRQKFHLDEKRKYILYSGRLVSVKRVDVLVDAFVQVADQRPDWDLLVVGDGVLRNALLSRVPEKFRHRVIWTGFLQERECAVAYHAAEFLVLPSEMEPWALVVPEALAAGRPVVASDSVGAAYELINDHQNGCIFPVNDVSALARCLLQATDEASLRKWQANARPALDAWRKQVDPIVEVRRALEDIRVLERAQANESATGHGDAVASSCSLPAPSGSRKSTD